ncbi:hypothetical protein SEA_PUPPER_2 [Gordonia phage Pupper]|uniref:Uncharacterized protein n=1 Tax=Gordonia phage Pupper TaxID=2571249 RepID=A0A4Y6ERX3_9CAUD|nr:hypothetical protein KHQ83_gp002 [Gordonia phage Pupper]QDF18489.1 hypothetical protein SEA_PUPPER_2 [Gordonia phage Pupper]QDF18722.1 hypothetical protein SEA_SCENTAE_2 [Gordonia phage SCentae]
MTDNAPSPALAAIEAQITRLDAVLVDLPGGEIKDLLYGYRDLLQANHKTVGATVALFS